MSSLAGEDASFGHVAPAEGPIQANEAGNQEQEAKATVADMAESMMEDAVEDKEDIVVMSNPWASVKSGVQGAFSIVASTASKAAPSQETGPINASESISLTTPEEETKESSTEINGVTDELPQDSNASGVDEDAKRLEREAQENKLVEEILSKLEGKTVSKRLTAFVYGKEERRSRRRKAEKVVNEGSETLEDDGNLSGSECSDMDSVTSERAMSDVSSVYSTESSHPIFFSEDKFVERAYLRRKLHEIMCRRPKEFHDKQFKMFQVSGLRYFDEELQTFVDMPNRNALAETTENEEEIQYPPEFLHYGSLIKQHNALYGFRNGALFNSKFNSNEDARSFVTYSVPTTLRQRRVNMATGGTNSGMDWISLMPVRNAPHGEHGINPTNGNSHDTQTDESSAELRMKRLKMIATFSNWDEDFTKFAINQAEEIMKRIDKHDDEEGGRDDDRKTKIIVNSEQSLESIQENDEPPADESPLVEKSDDSTHRKLILDEDDIRAKHRANLKLAVSKRMKVEPIDSEDDKLSPTSPSSEKEILTSRMAEAMGLTLEDDEVQLLTELNQEHSGPNLLPPPAATFVMSPLGIQRADDPHKEKENENNAADAKSLIKERRSGFFRDSRNSFLNSMDSLTSEENQADDSNWDKNSIGGQSVRTLSRFNRESTNKELMDLVRKPAPGTFASTLLSITNEDEEDHSSESSKETGNEEFDSSSDAQVDVDDVSVSSISTIDANGTTPHKTRHTKKEEDIDFDEIDQASLNSIEDLDKEFEIHSSLNAAVLSEAGRHHLTNVVTRSILGDMTDHDDNESMEMKKAETLRKMIHTIDRGMFTLQTARIIASRSEWDLDDCHMAIERTINEINIENFLKAEKEKEEQEIENNKSTIEQAELLNAVVAPAAESSRGVNIVSENVTLDGIASHKNSSGSYIDFEFDSIMSALASKFGYSYNTPELNNTSKTGSQTLNEIKILQDDRGKSNVDLPEDALQSNTISVLATSDRDGISMLTERVELPPQSMRDTGNVKSSHSRTQGRSSNASSSKLTMDMLARKCGEMLESVFQRTRRLPHDAASHKSQKSQKMRK